MPYLFTATDSTDALPFANMKAFREWMPAIAYSIEGISVSYDESGTEIGKLRYVKNLPGGAPTMVTPDPDSTTTLDDVLADIDALELDDAADAGVVDDDLSDPHADDDVPPVRLEGTPAEDIDALVDWQLSRRDVPPFTGNGPAPRVRYARMSHKACGHATTGEEGKIARAACRARHRGLGDVAAAS